MMESVSAYGAWPVAVVSSSARLSTNTTWPGRERSIRFRIAVAWPSACAGLPVSAPTSTWACTCHCVPVCEPGTAEAPRALLIDTSAGATLAAKVASGRITMSPGGARLPGDAGRDVRRGAVAADRTLPVERHASDSRPGHRAERVTDEEQHRPEQTDRRGERQ